MAKSRKLPMKKREDKNKRSVSFTKRRTGLFNKAAELSMLCDAQLAVLVSSPCPKPKRKIFSFGHPSVDAVLDAFLENHVPDPVDARAKQHALSLLSEIKELESEIKSICVQKNKKLENVATGFSSIFACFDKSQSTDELQAVVDALVNFIDRVKIMVCSPISYIPSNVQDYKFGSNSALPLKISIDNNEKSLMEIPESTYYFNYNDLKGKQVDCNIITKPAVPTFVVGGNGYDMVDVKINSRQAVNWSLTGCSTSNFDLSDVAAKRCYNESSSSDLGAIDDVLDIANQDVPAAADYEDLLGWLYS